MDSSTPLDHEMHKAIDRFWETVPPVWNAVRAHLRGVAADDFGMTVEQFHSLRLIRRGYRTASEIAEAKGISRPAVSQAVETLVQKGLVTRTQSETDRRYVTLALTEAGSHTLDQIFGQTRQWMTERMGGLSAEDMQIVSAGLAILKDVFVGAGE